MIQQEGHREAPAAAARGGEGKSPAKAALEQKKTEPSFSLTLTPFSTSH